MGGREGKRCPQINKITRLTPYSLPVIPKTAARSSPSAHLSRKPLCSVRGRDGGGLSGQFNRALVQSGGIISVQPAATSAPP